MRASRLGRPTRKTCRSRSRPTRRLVRPRISSSASAGRSCASSMTRTGRRPLLAEVAEARLEAGQEECPGDALGRHVEADRDHAQDVLGVEPPGDELGDREIGPRPPEALAHERGLPGAGLAGQHEHALALRQRVVQVGAGALVGVVRESCAGGRAQSKGIARQAVEGCVHGGKGLVARAGGASPRVSRCASAFEEPARRAACRPRTAREGDRTARALIPDRWTNCTTIRSGPRVRSSASRAFYHPTNSCQESPDLMPPTTCR